VRWRGRLTGHVETAIRLGQLSATDPARPAIRCAAFTHGLVVQALFDPDRITPEVQIRLLEEFLTSLE
jgi:hypothetical protein